MNIIVKIIQLMGRFNIKFSSLFLIFFGMIMTIAGGFAFIIKPNIIDKGIYLWFTLVGLIWIYLGRRFCFPLKTTREDSKIILEYREGNTYKLVAMLTGGIFVLGGVLLAVLSFVSDVPLALGLFFAGIGGFVYWNGSMMDEDITKITIDKIQRIITCMGWLTLGKRKKMKTEVKFNFNGIKSVKLESNIAIFSGPSFIPVWWVTIDGVYTDKKGTEYNGEVQVIGDSSIYSAKKEIVDTINSALNLRV